MDKKITIINYNHNDIGVGSFRTKFFEKYLTKNGYDVQVISKQDNMPFYKWFIFSLKTIKNKTVLISIPNNYVVFLVFFLFFNKKLILDMRDPWSHNIKNIWKYKNKYFLNLKYQIVLLIEKTSYKLVDNFIVCTYGMNEYYKSIFKDDKKLILIENGSDLSFKNLIETKSDKNIQCIIAGNYFKYSEYKGKKLLNFIDNLAKKIDISVVVVGCEKEIVEYVEKNCLNIKSIDFVGVVDYCHMSKYLFESDIGLFVERCEKTGNTTKIFDYLLSDLVLISYVDDLNSNTVQRFQKEGVFFVNELNFQDVINEILEMVIKKEVKRIDYSYSRAELAKIIINVIENDY